MWKNQKCSKPPTRTGFAMIHVLHGLPYRSPSKPAPSKRWRSALRKRAGPSEAPVAMPNSLGCCPLDILVPKTWKKRGICPQIRMYIYIYKIRYERSGLFEWVTRLHFGWVYSVTPRCWWVMHIQFATRPASKCQNNQYISIYIYTAYSNTPKQRQHNLQ